MPVVQSVDPAKELVRKAIVFFQDESERLAERLQKLKRMRNALQVVREYSRNKAVSDADLISVEKQVEEAQAELELCKRRQNSLPTLCYRCGGERVERGTRETDFDVYVCHVCNGIGFLERP